MITILLFIAIGLFAGILSGFFGVGGGILIVPALIYICGFTQLKAQGTSLMVLLPPVGLFAFLEYHKKGNVDIKAGVLICIALLVGAALGGKVSQYVSTGMLRRGFAIFMLVVAVKLLLD